mgnify:CR=1 FL=1
MPAPPVKDTTTQAASQRAARERPGGLARFIAMEESDMDDEKSRLLEDAARAICGGHSAMAEGMFFEIFRDMADNSQHSGTGTFTAWLSSLALLGETATSLARQLRAGRRGRL